MAATPKPAKAPAPEKKTKERRAIVLVENGIMHVHAPVLGPAGGPKWIPGDLLGRVDANAYPAEIRQKLFDHGIRQKFPDAWADPEIGGDPSAIRSCIADMDEQLAAGLWAERGSTGGVGNALDFLKAYVSVVPDKKGRPADDYFAAAKAEHLRRMALPEDDAARKQWVGMKDHPAIKSAMAKLALERAQARAAKLAGEAKGHKVQVDLDF